MKKLIILLALTMLCAAAHAETARDYALYLEEALPDAAFADAEVPDFVTKNLGGDYDFIARTDAKYGGYIAGVRRATAPALPADVHQSADRGTFETRVFRAEDGEGNIYYDFVLADGVYMYAYDGLEHLIIWIDPDAGSYSEFQKMFSGPSSMIFNAANPQYRAQMRYAADHGFSPEDQSRAQLCMYVHNIDTWRAGATDQPHAFYLDIAVPEDLTGENFLEEDELIQFTRIPIGLYVKEGGDYRNDCELVISESGVKAVETDDPHRLYEAGPGYDALVDIAAEVLGYRPGEADFPGKRSVRATLEWRDGSIRIEDAKKLRRLDEMFRKADFSVGSVNCPSPCFLTMEYADGTGASMAVAVNSFDLFFFNGLYFTAGDGELIELFNLKETTLYRDIYGG